MDNGLFKVREYDHDKAMTVYMVDENEDGLIFLVYDLIKAEWKWVRSTSVCPA